MTCYVKSLTLRTRAYVWHHESSYSLDWTMIVCVAWLISMMMVTWLIHLLWIYPSVMNINDITRPLRHPVFVATVQGKILMSEATHTSTTCWIWSVISSFSILNRWSSPLGLFYHDSLKRDQGDWDWRLRINHTPNATGCTLHIYKWAMSHTSTNHVTHMDLAHQYAWWWSHDLSICGSWLIEMYIVCTYNEAVGLTSWETCLICVTCLLACHNSCDCLMYEFVLRHVAHRNQSCRIYHWVVLHICRGHVTYRNVSCRIYKWVSLEDIKRDVTPWIIYIHIYNSRSHVSLDVFKTNSFIYATGHISISDMTSAYV